MSVWDDIAAAAASYRRSRMPQNVRTFIVPSTGNPAWDSVPVEVIVQESFSPPSFVLNSVPVETIVQETTSSSYDGNVHINWLETPAAHVIQADVPGMRRQDLQVSVEGGPVLQIRGERFETWPFDNVDRHRVERWIGGFVRCFRLPDDVVIDRISAELDLGVLTITVPKVQRFPPIQWFIPIRTVDRERSSSSLQAWRLTDVFPPRNTSLNGTPQITSGGEDEDEERQSRSISPRASLGEDQEDPTPSTQRASQRRSSEASNTSSRRNSTRVGIDSQAKGDASGSEPTDSVSELEPPAAAAAADHMPEEPPVEAEVDETTEEAVRMILENILQALEADRTRSSSRRASPITGIANDSSPPETSSSTQVILESLATALQKRISPSSSSGNGMDPDVTRDTTTKIPEGSRRSSRKASGEIVSNLQGRRLQTLPENDPQIVLDQNHVLGTAGPRRPSRPASETDQKALPQNPPGSVPLTNASHDSASEIPRSRKTSKQTDELSVQRRSSQIVSENNREPSSGQERDSRPAGSRRAPRRAYTEAPDPGDNSLDAFDTAQ